MEEGVRANPEDYALLTEYGKALVRNGQFSEAVGVLERAVALIDYDPESWDNLGRARMRAGDHAKALEAFETAVSLDPSSASAHADIGTFRLSRFLDGGRNRATSTKPSRISRRRPRSTPTLNAAFRGLGNAYRMDGRIEAAIAAWERAIAIAKTTTSRPITSASSTSKRATRLGRNGSSRHLLERRGPGMAPADRDNLLALIEKCK